MWVEAGGRALMCVRSYDAPLGIDRSVAVGHRLSGRWA